MLKLPQECLCHAQSCAGSSLWEAWLQQGCGGESRRPAAAAISQLFSHSRRSMQLVLMATKAAKNVDGAHALLPSQAEVGPSSYIFDLSICTQTCFRKLHLQKTFSCSQVLLQTMLSLVPTHIQVSTQCSKKLLLLSHPYLPFNLHSPFCSSHSTEASPVKTTSDRYLAKSNGDCSSLLT